MSGSFQRVSDSTNGERRADTCETRPLRNSNASVDRKLPSGIYRSSFTDKRDPSEDMSRVVTLRFPADPDRALNASSCPRFLPILAAHSQFRMQHCSLRFNLTKLVHISNVNWMFPDGAKELSVAAKGEAVRLSRGQEFPPDF